MFNPTTKTGKLFAALVTEGQELTAAQIATRFNAKNPTAMISEIRYAGFPIYANSKTNSKGDKVTVYRHGKASRQLVRAGYKALSLGINA
jgi:hypothetical protein